MWAQRRAVAGPARLVLAPVRGGDPTGVGQGATRSRSGRGAGPELRPLSRLAGRWPASAGKSRERLAAFPEATAREPARRSAGAARGGPESQSVKLLSCCSSCSLVDGFKTVFIKQGMKYLHQALSIPTI